MQTLTHTMFLYFTGSQVYKPDKHDSDDDSDPYATDEDTEYYERTSDSSSEEERGCHPNPNILQESNSDLKATSSSAHGKVFILFNLRCTK